MDRDLRPETGFEAEARQELVEPLAGSIPEALSPEGGPHGLPRFPFCTQFLETVRQAEVARADGALDPSLKVCPPEKVLVAKAAQSFKTTNNIVVLDTAASEAQDEPVYLVLPGGDFLLLFVRQGPCGLALVHMGGPDSPMVGAEALQIPWSSSRSS